MGKTALKLAKRNVFAGYATIDEAADFLAICRARVYQLMERGHIRWCNFGRSRRIPWTEIEDYGKREMLNAAEKAEIKNKLKNAKPRR